MARHKHLRPLAEVIADADSQVERALAVLLATATPKEYRALVREAKRLTSTNCWWATKRAGDLVLARGEQRKRARRATNAPREGGR